MSSVLHPLTYTREARTDLPNNFSLRAKPFCRVPKTPLLIGLHILLLRHAYLLVLNIKRYIKYRPFLSRRRISFLFHLPCVPFLSDGSHVANPSYSLSDATPVS